ncbi:hypothetical protein Tco_0023822, partial [Tanacetum coccineum]
TSTIAPVISYAAPLVETTLVASPTGLCGLIPYSDSDSDSPDEMSSSEHISSLPAISPFLCTDSSEAPDSSDGPLCYRCSLEEQARRLAWRHASPRSSDHHPSSSSSSSDSSLVHSSGLDAPDQAHSGSSTRDVSPRLESSLGDSSERPLHSSLHSAGPSRKRCRSLVDFVPSSTLVMGSLAPTRADLLPPCKRFRDLYSSEASIEEDTGIDPIETEVDMELGIGDGDDVRDHVEIDPMDVRDDTKGSFEDMPIDLDDVASDFYHHMSEVRIDRIIGIETVQRRLEA